MGMHGTGQPLGLHTREVPAAARAAALRTAEALRSARQVLILGHVGADGDVAGSSLGLAAALREQGKHVVVYNQQPYPAAYAWLPGGEAVVQALDANACFDVTVVVDAARDDRLGRDFPDANRRGTWVWIDHHHNPSPPGDVVYIDLTAAAVGEQIALVLDAMGHPMSRDVALCLYASLLADTGGFRYGNTSVRAFQLAARLVEAGVDPWEMTERIFESQDEARMRLLGRALQSLWLSPCGRVGIVALTDADLCALNAHDDHVQGLVNHVRGIKGVEIAVLLREHIDSGGARTRAVMRSRGNIPVGPVAAALGGLGHRNAANFTLHEELAPARERVLNAALAALTPPAVHSAAE